MEIGRLVHNLSKLYCHFLNCGGLGTSNTGGYSKEECSYEHMLLLLLSRSVVSECSCCCCCCC